MPNLLFVEGLPQYENVNEAELLDQTFSVLKKGCDGRRARWLNTVFKQPATKDDFLSLLEGDYDYIHISAHGERTGKGKSVIYVRNRGIVTAKDIHKLKIKADVVFSNACETYEEDLIAAFLAAGTPKRRIFIAPKNCVNFDEAYIIALLFWKRLTLDKRTPWRSLSQYAYKLPGFRANFWYNDDVKAALNYIECNSKNL